MEVLGFVFGISGMSFGLMGFILAINALNQIKALEDRIDGLAPIDQPETALP